MAKQKAAAAAHRFDSGEFGRLFLAADYAGCRALLATGPVTEVTALASSRVDLREGRAVDVIERLAAMRPSDPNLRMERDIVLARANAETGDTASAHRLLERVCALPQAPAELALRALYERAYAARMDGNWAQVERDTRDLMACNDPLHRALAHLLVGRKFAENGDALGQLTHAVHALDELDFMPRPDAFVRANALYVVATLAWELGDEAAAQRARTAYETISPASGTQAAYFRITRALAWIDALQGDELAAFRRFRRAADLAPSEYWRVLCIADRAQLARASGERAFALDQIFAADDLAAKLSWNETPEEERIGLLSLAELFAETDGALAQRYLAQFRSLRSPMQARLSPLGEMRLRALQTYSSGAALFRLNENAAARRLLEEAYELFARFGYGWRAALAALQLYRMLGEPAWLTRARACVASWPQSWIARDVRDAQHAGSANGSLVSRAQRPILELLLQGRRNAEIAATLGKSPNTVRNHIAEIFRTYHVKSRAELIALLSARKR